MPIDLRSDTVTKPTPAMRAAMANAEVGDDVYREDPTTRALEERVAALTGKEAALFVSSGTMGNQLAILVSTRPGDEIICGEGAHCAFFESGAAPMLSGVQFAFAGRGGLFTAEDMEAQAKPDAYWHPHTSLVAIENTHNRAGGRVFAQSEIERIASKAHENGFKVHIDGARLWNAAAATKTSIKTLLAPADTASLCFSKGLGAPVGSVLVGSKSAIQSALRFRKMLGGGTRQAGILAAACLYALDHHVERLVDDQRRARAFAEAIAKVPGASVDLAGVETNIVNVDVPGLRADAVVKASAARGVLWSPSGPSRLRAVFHLDVSEDDALAAQTAVAAAITEVRG